MSSSSAAEAKVLELFLCKQCELVQKMLPGGREALKRSRLVVLLVLVKLDLLQSRTKTQDLLSTVFPFLLHTSKLVFCVWPES